MLTGSQGPQCVYSICSQCSLPDARVCAVAVSDDGLRRIVAHVRI